MNARVMGLPAGDFRDHDVNCFTSDGREVTFLKNDLVRPALIKCLENLKTDLENARVKEEVYLSLSRFWISFISIHPFENGNGRTGKAIITKALADNGVHKLDLTFLDTILLTGNYKEDLRKLVLASIEASSLDFSVKAL